MIDELTRNVEEEFLVLVELNIFGNRCNEEEELGTHTTVLFKFIREVMKTLQNETVSH